MVVSVRSNVQDEGGSGMELNPHTGVPNAIMKGEKGHVRSFYADCENERLKKLYGVDLHGGIIHQPLRWYLVVRPYFHMLSPLGFLEVSRCLT